MNQVPSVGRTVWDILSEILSKGLPWLIAVIVLVCLVYIVIHPNIAKEWNVILSTFISRFIPKKRKKTFERRIDLTLERARRATKEAFPEYTERFLPYDLKVEWIEPKDECNADNNLETEVDNRQIVVYVPSYKEEEKQTINVLYHYSMKGFATRPKCYMSSEDKKATDLVVTEKLAQNAGHHVYDYFNRVYIQDILSRDPSFQKNYDEIKKIDKDGLFLPIYINEADKYASRIYQSGVNSTAIQTLESFKKYLLRIIEKQQDEDVDLMFNQDGIAIHIELAVKDSFHINQSIERIIERLENLVINKNVNTIYVIASGSKMNSANTIVTKLEEKVTQDIFEPKCVLYKRYTRVAVGIDSICYEINVR